MVVVDEEGFHSYKLKLLPDKTSFCLFEYVYIARPDSVINGVCVHNARFKAGELLYDEFPIEADMVCGVPDSGLIADRVMQRLRVSRSAQVLLRTNISAEQ